MKRLSDFTGDEAIAKAGELLSPYYKRTIRKKK